MANWPILRFVFFCLILTGPLISKTFAQEQIVRVLETTKTKNTFQINLGEFDGVKFDDLAVFLIRPDPEKSRTYYVGKGVAVKVFPYNSIWHMTELKDPLAISRGEEIIIIKKDDANRGIHPIKYHRKKLVLRSQTDHKVRDSLDSYQGKIPKNLIQKKNEYAPSGAPLNETNIPGDDEELDLLDLYAIKKDDEKITNENMEELDSLYVKELQKAPNEEDVDAKIRDNKFGERIKEHLDRLSDTNGTTKEMNQLHMDSSENLDSPMRRLTPNVYDLAMDEKRVREEKRREVKKWIKQTGPRWSEDFSDEELSDFIEENGLRKEKERQEEASLNLSYHEIHFDVGLHIIDKSSHTDDNINRKPYTLQTGIEYHLSKRYPKLNRFTADASARLSYDNIDLSDKNGKYSEQSLRFVLFWYPWHLPSALNSNILFTGAGVRIGQAQIEATRLNIVAPYQVKGLPTLHVGWKYRLTSGLGYRVMMSLEKMDLTLQNSDNNTTHPDEITFLDQKIEIGLMYSF